MSAELVKRLREKIRDTVLAGLPYNRDGDEAADLIEFQGHENKRLIAEVMIQMRWKTDTQQYADKLEAEIMRLREALAFYANGMEPFGNTARNALENKP